MAGVGECLRYQGTLEATLREWTICVVARERKVVKELVRDHRIGEQTCLDALARWGEPTLVELLTLAGYFCMVSWLMNAARTPGAAQRESRWTRSPHG